jgi:superfamily II DNA/RNA helicase
MEQIDRERALIKFRNGTHQILIATDLAARGIDIPEIEFIIHYQLPNREHEFTHRNGRTARMHKKGTAYIIKSKNIDLPEYVRDIDVIKIEQIENKLYSQFTTLYISGGRKHKISKGDIAGLFFKQGKLERDDLGVIELKTDCAYVAVKNEKVKELLPLINNTKLKTKKVRITIL